MNILHLWAVAQINSYRSPVWGGFGSWKKLGGFVRRGEKGSVIIFSQLKEKKDKNNDVEVVRISTSHTVFNRDQIDGLEDAEMPETTSALDDMQATKTVEALCNDHGVIRKHGGNKAFYHLTDESITMPDKDRFVGTSNQSADVSYASTLAHELTHWTGHESRCERKFRKRDTAEYAKEELIAELGSAFLCAQLSIQYTGVADHAGYLEHWLRDLKADNSALFTASAEATRAVSYLLSDKLNGESQEKTEVAIAPSALSEYNATPARRQGGSGVATEMKTDKDKPWVSASQIAQAEYCPYQLYLASQGAIPLSDTQSSLDTGNEAHQRFNQRLEQDSGTATAKRWFWLTLALLTAVVGIWLAQ